MYESNLSQLGLMFGTFVAQILSLVSTIVIARLLTPSLYGKYSISLIILTTLMPFSTKKVETYLVNAKIAHVYSIMRETIIRIFILSGIYGVILSGISSFLWDFKLFEVITYGLGIFLINLIINFGVLAIALSLRTRNFFSVAMSGIWQNGLTLVTQIVMLQISNSIETLLYGFLLGRCLALIIFFFWKDFRNSLSTVIKFKVLNSKGEHRVRRDIYLASILDQISLNSPLVIALLINNQNLLGVSSLALIIALAPATLIISGFSMTFLTYGSLSHTEKELQLKNNFFVLITLSLMYLLSLHFVVGLFGERFFGENWLNSIKFVQYFAIPISLLIIISPYLQLKTGMGEVKISRISNIGGILGVAFVFFTFYGRFSEETIIEFVLFGKAIGQLLPIVTDLLKVKKPRS